MAGSSYGQNGFGLDVIRRQMGKGSADQTSGQFGERTTQVGDGDRDSLFIRPDFPALDKTGYFANYAATLLVYCATMAGNCSSNNLRHPLVRCGCHAFL
jgi:hypothetical protein